jgi:uncharacterized protein YjbI with pentapeptide repeats
MANEEHLKILKQGVEQWNKWRSEHARWENAIRPDLGDADLSDAFLGGADLSGASLSSADLSRASLCDAKLSSASLSSAKLSRAKLFNANLSGADLSDANLSGARLFNADLSRANLSDEAKLRGANLSDVDLHGANLTSADLTDADLSLTRLVETDFTNATITGCRIYGASAWNVTLEGTSQNNLVITKQGEAVVTVDDLEVAQFIYLMLENRKIRRVLDTITSKAVLILGRFTDDRKAVLECVRRALRERFGMVPILFDFPPSASRDLTETIQLLASMCRFVIADLTDAKSIPQELSQIVPSLPSVPVQPILLSTQREYAMFEHWRRFPNVLPEFLYDDRDHLLDHFKSGVIDPVKAWEEVTNKEAARTRQLREMVQAQEGEIAMLKAKLQRDD